MITETQIKNNQNLILNYLSTIDRPGMQDLIKWLQESDFFTAPASTPFHRAYPGGLAEHSSNVLLLLMKRASEYDVFAALVPDSIILTALLHDVCKIGLYSLSGSKYRLNFDVLKEGHGRRSVALISRFIALEPQEKSMIFYHMGPYGAHESGCKGTEYSLAEYIQACNSMPHISLLHECDNQEAKWIQ
jgi:hypothetical protein